MFPRNLVVRLFPVLKSPSSFGLQGAFAICYALVAMTCGSGGISTAQGISDSVKSPESDTTSLIPSSIKDFSVEIVHEGQKVPVRVQYAVQGQTIFLLPVWVAGDVVKVIDGQETRCKPADRLLPADETRALRLVVGVRNLLDDPGTEKIIEQQIRQRVLDQQGLEPSSRFRIERPNINASGIRFTLIGPGRGDSSSPAEIAVADPVSRPANNRLNFMIQPEAVRKVETDLGLAAGLPLAELKILPNGPMKVRFERLEMDAQIRYLRATLEEFRKRVASVVNPGGGSAPSVVVPMGGTGTAETRNVMKSMLRKSLEVTVSTRQGTTDLPLKPFLEKVVDSMVETSTLDKLKDDQRVTFLMDNQVSITATLGEVRRISKLTESERSEAFRKAFEHASAMKSGKNSNYTGSLNLGFANKIATVAGIVGMERNGGLSGGVQKGETDQRESSAKREEDLQKAAFDRLMTDFEGKMPTLSGIAIDDETLTKSATQVESSFRQTSFFVDDTLHRFPEIALTGSIDAGLALADLLRSYSTLRNDYENLRNSLATPEKLAEAKANLDRLERISDDLRKSHTEAEQALERFRQASQAAIAQVDATEAAKLRQEVASIRKEIAEEREQAKRTMVRLRRQSQGEPLKFQGHTAEIHSVAFSPDGLWIASASLDKTVRLWNADSGQEVKQFNGHDQGVLSVAFSPDGKKIATGSWDNLPRVWDVSTGEEIRKFFMHRHIVSCVKFSPDGKRIVSGSSDETARIWNVADGQELRILQGHSSTVRDVAFSPDGSRIATSSADRTAILWDAATGREMQRFTRHSDSLTKISFSPDGSRIASASDDKTVRIWDAATGRELQMIEGHTAPVKSVAFSPDGKQIATGSWDGTARVWEADTGKELFRLQGQAGLVNSVAFSPDGSRIATASDDKTVRIFDIGP